MQLNTITRICALVVAVSLTCSLAICIPQDDYRSSWSSTVKVSEIGRGDLNQTYEELLDYFLPRQMSNNASDKCYLVVRYLPAVGYAHQLNIIYDSSAVLSMWTFELRKGLPLTASEEAQKLASTLPVSVTRVTPSKSLRDFLTRDFAGGVPVSLRSGVVLHGDKYQAWGMCQLSRLESEITVPPQSNNAETEWMNKLWTQTQRGGVRGK